MVDDRPLRARRGPLHVLGFAGSLRKASLNRGLLRAAAELSPPDVVIEQFDLRGIPLYDEDLRLAGPPEIVTELKERIRAADGLLIATPEYNHSFSGVTKNAVDWISRPPAESPLNGKPIGVIGASDGHFGTTRAQEALRIVLAATRADVMASPTVMVFHGREHADTEGNLIDPELRERVRRYMTAFEQWIRRLGASIEEPIAEGVNE
jgi:chromate reductase